MKQSNQNAPAGQENSKTRTLDIVKQSLGRRRRAERRFQFFGKLAIVMALTFLGIMFYDIVSKGHTAFHQTLISMDLTYDQEFLEVTTDSSPQELASADYEGLIKRHLREKFPEVTARRDKKKLYQLISSGAAFQLADRIKQNPALLGTTESIWLPADDEVDMLVKGKIDRTAPEDERRVNNQQVAWVETFEKEGRVKSVFNTNFLSSGDSRNPELAGVWGAVIGSFLTLLVTLLLSFPIGIAAAVYLEEFAPKNKWTHLIEVNINNLAAVPSIVFGLLGLAVYINYFGLPRSAPLVGGLVLTLMTLPTIIISARASLKSVPNAIREGALGIGASKIQMITHHVLPIALPGMLTGAIIGMAQALGETAPLLMIGMVAFILEIPGTLSDPATVLPVQIFLWADSPERAFVEKTSGAIMVLLTFLIIMNSFAVFLRKRLEHRF